MESKSKTLCSLGVKIYGLTEHFIIDLIEASIDVFCFTKLESSLQFETLLSSENSITQSNCYNHNPTSLYSPPEYQAILCEKPSVEKDISKF